MPPKPLDFLQPTLPDATNVHNNIDDLIYQSDVENLWQKALNKVEQGMSGYNHPQPITGTAPDVAATPLVLARRFGHIFKEMSEGVHNRPLDLLLSKYGKSNHARIRALIEENKAIAMDLPERAGPLEKGIEKMIKIIEPDKVKHRKIINAWSQEEWDDFISPLQKRVLDLLKKK